MHPEEWAAKPKVSMPLERSVSFLKVPGAEKCPAGPLVAFLVAILVTVGADDALFSQIAKALERTVGLHVSTLTYLNTIQAFMMAFCGPVWGVLCARGYLDRTTILAILTLAQGLATAIMAFHIENVTVMTILRAVNGFALSGMLPVVQGIVADRFDDEVRGRMFALMNMSRGMGNTFSGVVFARTSEWCTSEGRLGDCGDGCSVACTCDGLFGWQYAFIITGVLTMAFAPLIYTFMKAPPVTLGEKPASGENIIVSELRGLGKILWNTPTFLILVLQGCVGMLAINALGMRTFFLETAGLDKPDASSIIFYSGLVGCVGGIGSGYLSDKLTGIFPLHGRIINAEISVYGAIPFCFFTFASIFAPSAESAFYYYLILSLGLDVIKGGVGGGTNAPILSQLAEPEERALLIAYQSALEGSVGAFGGQIFSKLMDWFNYQKECETECNRPIWCGPPEQNAEAAGTALLFTTCVPWLLCGALYTSLHYFYPRDMVRIFERRRLENEGAGAGLSTELTNA